MILKGLLADGAGDASSQRRTLEAAASSARRALEDWDKGPGQPLGELFDALRLRFAQLRESATDPHATHEAATALLATELARLQAVSAADQAAEEALAEVQEALRQGRSRLATIEAELEQDTGANQDLAQALTAISSHIHDETCPVCGRDFSEVSELPLAAHLSEEVQRLISAAGRVESLVRDRTATVAAVTRAQRQEGDLSARRLSSEQRDANKLEIAQIIEWRTGLAAQRDVAVEGTTLQG